MCLPGLEGSSSKLQTRGKVGGVLGSHHDDAQYVSLTLKSYVILDNQSILNLTLQWLDINVTLITIPQGVTSTDSDCTL